MGMLSGLHRQAGTGRCLRYRVSFERTASGEVCFAAVISEHAKYFPCAVGQIEGTVPGDPDGVPVDLAIRSAVMSAIDRTAFPPAQDPGPNWPGWYGPYL